MAPYGGLTPEPGMSPIKTIDQLTSLRFFAAAAIVFHHSKDVFELTRSVVSPVPLNLAVSFFFVLSGFILTYNYRNLRGRAEVQRFYEARIARIWPVHFLSFGLVLLLIPKGLWTASAATSQIAGITLSNLALLHAWAPFFGYFFSYNGVSWSISTELFFYVAFPWLIQNWTQTWHYKSAIVLLIAVSALTLSTLQSVPGIDEQHPMQLSSIGIGYISPIVRIVEFLMGIWTAKLFIQFEDYQGGSSVAWTVAEFLCLVAAFILWKLCLEYAIRTKEPNAWQVYLGSSGGAITFPFAIGVMAFGRGWISKMLRLKQLVLLGQASFALYMTHQLLIAFVYINKARYFSDVPDSALFLLYWSVCIVLSIGIFLYFEQPARIRMKAWFHALRQHVPRGKKA